MAIYAQFFTHSTGYIEGTIPPQFSKDAIRPIEACGDRGMVKLSGARMPLNQPTLRVARQECRRRGFVGFSIIAGESLLWATTIRAYEAVDSAPPAAPTGWAAVRAALNAIPTTDTQTCGEYWQCECNTHYIHVRDEYHCPECKHGSPDQPDAKLRDVIDHCFGQLPLFGQQARLCAGQVQAGHADRAVLAIQ